ncbi:uncharacterized protein Z518_08617 [Rhinocladiella mackenziei CBS 650.93]|uniref:Mitochondrial division protein 1 n=1 Tax=Rhinocladiella mackenziei CBS 650.93 TaxID=1442369 RepID=A0A0D2J1B2_9EURO|nr:uncharacterized protein Z518_08617 [Rhinocladiella mackenziei CBS 650.93]KIX02675.1 hypothetical protein Z518_08617 [Rhinocladiella mackenziei CBS 650.93]
MSGAPVPSAKLSVGERLRQRFRSRSRASSPTPAPVSTKQSPGSPLIQILASSSPPSAGLVAANSPNASAASSSSQQATSNPSSLNILNDALKRLSDRDRATLREYILPSSGDIDLVLKQSLAAAEEKQRYCLAKRWRFIFAGREVVVKEVADKVVSWLNRFKDVGDIAASVDPVHAGLPWAGIRMLLEAAVSEANQMASLLVGCETALYMINRLKAYMDFLDGLPTTLTRTNFETSATELYARILQFLAQAIQIYQSTTVKRAFKAFWKDSDVHDFEDACNELGVRVEIEASNCDRTLSAQDRERTGKLKQDLERVLKELKKSHKLQESLDRLEIKIDLGKLPYAEGAMFNSYGDDHVTCHPATRLDLLGQIQEWAQQPDGKGIFWLKGMAGTGKSTISRTIAQWLDGQSHLGVVDLGASFFFKRGEGDRGSASRFFSTITRQLVLKIPGLDDLIADVITSDPLIFDKALGEQFDKLLYQPLRKVDVTPRDSPILVLVVDALDECEKEGDIQTILDLWSRIPRITTIRLRLLLTSRPELPIRLGFKDMSIDAYQDMSVDAYQDIVLYDAVPRTTIQHDISTFLKDEFSKFRKNYNADPPSGTPLDPDWPGAEVLEALVDMAVPLFIVAATVYRFVSDINYDPKEQLETILKFHGTGQLEQMEQTYLPVLTQLTQLFSSSRDTEKLYQEFRMIVGSIVTLAEPLSRKSLAALLQISPVTLKLRLNPLYSVLRVPDDLETPIRTLHLSFGEFLLSNKPRHESFGVDGPVTHRLLLTKCLQLLSGPNGLRENLCDLTYPGQPRREVEQTVINERLSPAFQYACRYWVHHAQQSKVRIHDEDEVHSFLRKHLLHWLEALSLMNRVAEVIGHINVLSSLLSANGSSHLSAFLGDARRIVLSNRYIVELAPLQIYSSAMTFAPQTSLVRKMCGPNPKWILKCPITAATWSAELQTLEGHTHYVKAMAFSPDGSLLVSASIDHTVRLWKVSTGQAVQTLQGHTNSVRAVVFSPDGSLLASASDDGAVRLWKVSTGQAVQTLEGHTSLGHTNFVEAVAFSPDGSLLASASCDHTVRLWKVGTDQQAWKYEKLPGITTISFSLDNTALLTNRGTISIDDKTLCSTIESSNETAITIKNGWLRQGDYNLLWLPLEYRRDSSAFYGNTIAIGLNSGQVKFIQLDNLEVSR